jgi:hypothetical protein
MTEEKAIKMHLSYSPPKDGRQIYSSFAAALRDAREATGRDVDTGDKKPGRSHGNWLGAIGYMILLDQIGSCFKRKGREEVRRNRIYRALSYFTNLNDKEKSALYALRCAFAHDFALYNVHPKGNADLTHVFKLVVGNSHSLVTLPSNPWNEDFRNKPAGTETIINLEKLGDEVEKICQTIFNLAYTNELEVVLGDGSDELISMYWIYKTGNP